MKAVNFTRASSSKLSAIAGYGEQHEAIRSMVEACWITAYTLLFNGMIVSDKEQQSCKLRLKSELIHANDLNTGFDMIIQRLVLARLYLCDEQGWLPGDPVFWFEARHDQGFNKTCHLFERMQAVRKHNPLHRIGVQAFADAIYDYNSDPGYRMFHYWRSYFQQRGYHSLLNMFISFAANYHNRG